MLERKERFKAINDIIDEIREKNTILSRTENPDIRSKLLNEISDNENNLYKLMDSYDERDNSSQYAFINAIQACAGVKRSTEIEQPIIKYLSEKRIADGEILITPDIQTDVKSLRRRGINLEDYVNIEPVYSLEGIRTYEIGEVKPLEIVESLGLIPEISKESLVNVKFNIKKSAGRFSVPNEVLADNGKVVLKWLKKILSEKTRVTRNKAIIDKANEITNGKEIQVTTEKELKNIFNKILDTSYTSNTIVITNQGGYDFLDGLRDAIGNNLALKVENQKPLLFGLYPVIRVPDSILPNDTATGAYPILCGDFEAAITLFDRERLAIDMSGEAGSSFIKFKTEIRVKDYFDVQAVDTNAIIKAVVPVGGSGN